MKKIYETFVRWNIERGRAIAALGGGALTDAMGFATATFKRGCELVSIPTTLLGQIDAAIGGKNAINVGNIKNLVGTFKFPLRVFVDPAFTLSQEERRFFEGLVEAIKIGLVASREFFELIENSMKAIKKRNLKSISELIEIAIRLKLKISEKDPFDTNERRILNFGHTLGHAIEIQYGLSHGEAISLGMILALKLSSKLGTSKPSIIDRVRELLNRIGMPTDERIIDISLLIDKMSQDKKIKKGKLSMILIRDIGMSEIKELEVKELCEYLS